MRMKRKVESDEHRRQRLEQNAQERLEDGAAADKAVDDMVRRSITAPWCLIAPRAAPRQRTT